MGEVQVKTTEEQIEKYTSLPYTKTLTLAENGNHVVQISEIPNLIAEGKTVDQAMELINLCLKYYLKDSINNNTPIPIPKTVEAYSGKFMIRMKPQTHYELTKEACKKGVSINQIILSSIESYLTHSLPSP
jgi:predicted RNase H-like HicB family nuclease